MADTITSDELQKKLEKLSMLDRREYFVINTNFECQFSCKDNTRGPSFSEWKKDDNSPAEFSMSEQLSVVDRSDYTKHYIGSMQLQRDLKTYGEKIFATLWLKDINSKSDKSKWDRMLVVTDLFV